MRRHETGDPAWLGTKVTHKNNIGVHVKEKHETGDPAWLGTKVVRGDIEGCTSDESFLQETMEPVWTPNWTNGNKKRRQAEEDKLRIQNCWNTK